ncbi:hypothetical protein [Psychrobacillus psychrodurans]|uniref:hypothetical protein n=1 Tax=Psychrobacillus psychrodurans TaxID=126157 RepID=UPI003D0097A9
MIRPAMKVWHEVTETLLKLTRNTDEADRDETIASIEKCLDVREKMQSQITAPFTTEEEVLGKKLLTLEGSIQEKLTIFTKQIRSDIFETKSKKSNMKSYVTPYSNVMRDGTFYDTKQ